MDIKELANRALLNRAKAYAPYSNFSVGAALLTSDGEVFDGVNVENASYGLTICAERSAVVNAVTAGKNNFQAIAIACGDGDFCAPCGACRQVLIEFSSNMDVIMVNSQGETKTQSIADLLPDDFSLKGGKQNV